MGSLLFWISGYTSLQERHFVSISQMKILRILGLYLQPTRSQVLGALVALSYITCSPTPIYETIGSPLPPSRLIWRVGHQGEQVGEHRWGALHSGIGWYRYRGPGVPDWV